MVVNQRPPYVIFPFFEERRAICRDYFEEKEESASHHITSGRLELSTGALLRN